MPNPDIASLQLDGGCFVFDFINTVNTRFTSPVREYLNSYKNILQWAKKTALLPQKRIQSLSNYADKNKNEAETAFTKAITAREILYKLFAAVVRNEKPDPAIIDKFNKLLSQSLGKMKLNILASKASINFSDDDISLDEPLRIIIKSGYDILITENFDRLKECPSCGWLFVDRTKNGKRRWCDMNVCGSNDKAKRYYHRKKAASPPL